MAILVKTEVVENPESKDRPYCIYTLRGRSRLRCFKKEETARLVSRIISLGIDAIFVVVAVFSSLLLLHWYKKIDLSKGLAGLKVKGKSLGISAEHLSKGEILAVREI